MKSCVRKLRTQSTGSRANSIKSLPINLLLINLLLGMGLSAYSISSPAEDASKPLANIVASLDTLPEVTVTATRSETAVDEVPATITVINREKLDRKIAADEADYFRDEPDVSMARDLRRFGATRVNIRGIEDNRVMQMVDGVRLSDYYDSGGPTNFTMNAPLGVSRDFLKRVEILRGPASSLYGSDAIGGVVGYITLDPTDVLTPGKDYGVRYRMGYSGENKGFSNSVLGAWHSDMLDVLLGYSHTDASEFRNKGSVDTVSVSRTKPNPQSIEDQGAIAKFVLRPAEGHTVSVMLEGREQNADVNVKRLSATIPKVTATSGEDNTQRIRASIDWEYKPQSAFYDRLAVKLYRQETDTDNKNVQTRTNTSATCSGTSGAGNNCLLNQSFALNQTSTGFGLVMDSNTKIWDKSHFFTYGIDISRVETEELRDATIRNLTTGTVTKSLAGDTFPTRDFPKGITDRAGIFVQDEITGLAGGPLSIIPSLRYDWNRLKPEVDALSQTALSANNRSAVEQTDSAFSPKLAAIWKLNPTMSLYGQAVTGFRAPNYNEVNGSFRNAVQQYAISPNADLKAETSVGVEGGIKWYAQKVRGQLSLYDTHYKDFIENVQLVCPGDARCISGVATTFINSNISSVRIYGAELRSAWDFTPGWSVDGALAWTRGENRSTNQPLNSVEPARLSLGLVREAADWGAEARVRSAAAVTRTDDTAGTWYRPAGYSVANLAAWWRPIKAGQFNIAVNNLFDKKYFLWSDIRQADSRNPVGVDFYSQSGRTVSASFSYQF
ncbi:MAG: TonB-dependent hemoglobin/transferrin/lactoferrin family receptor [Methylophilaceae bacterium]|nr:TonB-dependent hemoglobin/transferrin/lactoferrin family receptor [Methyloradius sp.]